MPAEVETPTVMGLRSRFGELIHPDWIRLLGGPADLDETRWTFVAYLDPGANEIDLARKLDERTRRSTNSQWHVGDIGRESGYRKLRSQSGRLFIVREGQIPYLAAFIVAQVPDYPEDAAFRELIQLAEHAEQNR
jgi:hypothetical protein